MKNLTLAVLSLTSLTFIAACGNSGGKNRNPFAPEGSEEQARPGAAAPTLIQTNATYMATFVTLNGQINGTLNTASATIKKQDDKLQAFVRLFAGKAQTDHKQAIYLGSRCPMGPMDNDGDGILEDNEFNDDTNKDHFIDILEANAVLGKIIMPLDMDISNQLSGVRSYPLADVSGYYHYEKITSFDKWFKDLTSEDKNPNDNIAKLAPNEEFSLEGRAIMIQGIDDATILPPTVGTENRWLPQQNFPIACGIFKKIDSIPGAPYVDQIPGAVAEVNPNADVPAPPGAGEITGEDTVIDTTTGNGTGEDSSSTEPIDDTEVIDTLNDDGSPIPDDQ